MCMVDIKISLVEPSQTQYNYNRIYEKLIVKPSDIPVTGKHAEMHVEKHRKRWGCMHSQRRDKIQG